jgi:type 1 glutamine amidotransferase
MKAFVIGGGMMVVETTHCLEEYLKEDGYEVYTTSNAEDLLTPAFKDCDLLVLNSCLWTGSGHTISEKARQALIDHYDLGKGVVVMHSSIGNWDDWPEYVGLVGGIWKWGHSNHSPADHQFTVVKSEEHPLLHGVPDAFEVTDEMYFNLAFADGNHVIARTSAEDGNHPMVWHRITRNSLVSAIMLGHDVNAVKHPQYIQLFKNACKWTMGA